MQSGIREIQASVQALGQLIEQSGGSLDDATMLQFATALEHAASRISELRNAPVETNVPTSAGLLWNMSGGNPEVFAKYMREVPDPEANALANNEGQLLNVIRKLQENAPQERNREIEGIPQAPLQSSNIWGFGYDQRNRKLYVRFQGDGIYEYDKVPPDVFNRFQSGAVPAKTEGKNNYGFWFKGKNPSLGASFYEIIKNGGYPYQKVS